MSNSASEYISATGIRMYKSVLTLPAVIYFEQLIQRDFNKFQQFSSKFPTLSN